MAKPYDNEEWEVRKADIIGLGERSFKKSYYPQLKLNVERLQRFHTLLDQTSDFVMLISLPDGLVTDANAAFGELVHQSPEQLIGRPFNNLGLDKNTCERVVDLLRRDTVMAQRNRMQPAHSLITQVNNRHHNLWLELSFRIALLENQYFGVMVGRDVTERKKNEEMMSALLAEKAALLDNAIVGIVSVVDRKIVSCNKRFEEMLGYKSGKTIGKSTRLLYETDEFFNNFGLDAYTTLHNGSQFSATIEIVRANGTKFWCELTGRAYNPAKPNDGSIWIFTDVNDRKIAEDKAIFLSHHDSLTQLPNHQLLKDRLGQAIAFAAQRSTFVALIAIDIDRFKNINDSLGYGIGNQILINIAERFSGCIQEIDTLSRQGGDEFLLLLPSLTSPEQSIPVINHLMRSLNAPFDVYGQEILLSASIGIAICPDDGNDFETLMKKADTAMYQAKSIGRNNYQFFNEAMNTEASELLTLSVGLKKALENQQLQLFYQPQIDIKSGRLIGAEALLRWFHPEYGMISPGRFIPVAEETGLIVPIGEWVIHEACREVLRWKQLGLDNAVVAVNLSALQFSHSDIEKIVSEAIEQAGITPEMLELELTESIMIRDTEKVLATVKRLKSMGIKLSIDDFGTGYSSLSYLKRFAVDKLKIDQAFIRDLVNSEDDTAIVKAIIQMANSLGLKTIAEGVETAKILDLLGVYQCDEVQGYYLGKPMPAADFHLFIQNYHSDYKI